MDIHRKVLNSGDLFRDLTTHFKHNSKDQLSPFSRHLGLRRLGRLWDSALLKNLEPGAPGGPESPSLLSPDKLICWR